jgi:hypothetical protein
MKGENRWQKTGNQVIRDQVIRNRVFVARIEKKLDYQGLKRNITIGRPYQLMSLGILL